MKNVLLSAPEDIIGPARASAVREYRALMRDLEQSGVRAGTTFTRDEMNER